MCIVLFGRVFSVALLFFYFFENKLMIVSYFRKLFAVCDWLFV